MGVDLELATAEQEAAEAEALCQAIEARVLEGGEATEEEVGHLGLARFAKLRATATRHHAEQARKEAADRARDAAVEDARRVLEEERSAAWLAERYEAARAALLELADATTARNDAMAEQGRRLHTAGLAGVNLANPRHLRVAGRDHHGIDPGDLVLVLVGMVAQERGGLPRRGGSTVEAALRSALSPHLCRAVAAELPVRVGAGDALKG
jgi:hypothetical protein